MGVGIGINGFGRIGRLVLRAAWGWPELEFRHINEIKGGTTAAAHLLEFDSVHGRWPKPFRPKRGRSPSTIRSLAFRKQKPQQRYLGKNEESRLFWNAPVNSVPLSNWRPTLQLG